MSGKRISSVRSKICKAQGERIGKEYLYFPYSTIPPSSRGAAGMIDRALPRIFARSEKRIMCRAAEAARHVFNCVLRDRKLKNI